MTITVLDRTWQIEIWPADPDQAPNAVYLEVRHKPGKGSRNDWPAIIRFGLTDAEVHRIAHALIAAATGDRAMEVLRSLQASTFKAPVASDRTEASKAAAVPKVPFTKTQGRYLAFIHRYIAKFHQPPAEADIQRHFLVSAPSVNAMMQTLSRKGLISRIPGVARSIKLEVPPELLPSEN